MKLRDYFLLGIVVSTVFACTSDDDVPEVHVFTPNATLSLATTVNGKTVTKAQTMDEATQIKAENEIYSLHVLVFSGYETNAPFQTEAVVSAQDGSALDELVVPDIPVEAGNATVLVLANDGFKTGDLKGKTLDKVLEETRSLDQETLTGGLLMSSALMKTTITINEHNIFGKSSDFSGHIPASIKGGAIELFRHVAQINLKSVEISESTPGAKFELKEMFVANAKGYTNIASNSTNRWSSVETANVSGGKKLWWYGGYVTATDWNGKYKTTADKDCILKSDLLSWKPESGTSASAPLKAAEAYFSYGKSFYVYENRGDDNTPLGQQTLLVLKGTYTHPDGREEEDRFYTVTINEPNKPGSTSSTENSGAVSHRFIKRNYRYNVSLTIKSSGSDRPYDPAMEACMDIVIKVADWDVVDMNEKLD